MAKFKYKVRRQSPIKGGREALPSCILKDIHRIVEHEAHIHKVSKSWVVAVALADFFGVKEQETFYPSKSGVQHSSIRRVK
jgi:hypothetical protein